MRHSDSSTGHMHWGGTCERWVCGGIPLDLVGSQQRMSEGVIIVLGTCISRDIFFQGMDVMTTGE